MRIMLVCQYFPPEVTAGAMRARAFAAGLAAQGHEVEVICAKPNHPHGVIDPRYRGRPVLRSVEDGVEVTRVWVHASPSKSASNRLANYGTFALAAASAGARSERPDVVLASSPPLTVGLAGLLLAKRHRVPWVLDVRDLWPDVALVLGQVGEGRVLDAARRLERRLYRSAVAIVAVTEPFRRHIEARGGEGKVTVIQNGTTQAYLDAGGREVDRAGLGLSADRFLWTYAGNMGLAQGLDAAVAAAARLGDEFELLLLGDGPVRSSLQGQAAEPDAGGVVFRDPVPPDAAAAYMRASDALLVPLADRPELADYVPSKLFDCCAVGRPVVVAAAGEPQRLVAETGAALAVPPGDPVALADAVRSLRSDPSLAAGLSERGRAFAAENLRSRGVERLAELLQRVSAT